MNSLKKDYQAMQVEKKKKAKELLALKKTPEYSEMVEKTVGK